jgi:hypothetical protein
LRFRYPPSLAIHSTAWALRSAGTRRPDRCDTPLKGLEQDGLVSRTMYPTIPPRVDYELTDLGRSLIVPLRSLHSWAVEHRPAMLAAREAFAKREQ